MPNGSSAATAPPRVAPIAKRKAEDDTDQSCNTSQKVPRRDVQALPARPPAASLTKPLAKPTTNGSTSGGLSRPNSAGQAAAKPMIKTTTNTGVGKATISPASAGTAPKKGSFAETLARAAATQKASTTKPSLGTIQHKATEKLSNQEKKARLEQLKNQKLGAKSARSGSRPLSRSQSPEKGKSSSATAVKPKKTSADLGYKGTMRPSAPAAPAYKGTMRTGLDAAKPKEQSKARYAGYTSYSDEDDDEEEEGYDDLSDMEAGMDEMYEEEEFSLRHAKREDLEAKKEEDRLKREKEQRKKLLQRR